MTTQKRTIVNTNIPKLNGLSELMGYAQKLRKDNNGELVITDIQLEEAIYALELEENNGFSMQIKKDLRRRQNVFGEYLD